MLKMLLVEDNLNYRRTLKNAFLKRFADLETREDSGNSDTLNTVNAYDPDLIIMDIDLEFGVNGLDLTKAIKDKYPNKVVVILSQNDIPEYRSVALQNGADNFFSKSSSLESIFEYVNLIIKDKQITH